MIRVSAAWAAVALLLLLGLAWLAPDALLLLAFLGLVVLSHEAGHLLVARLSGIAPTEFYWGFGPELLAVDRGGCRYGIRVLPLGGYVRLEGMTPSASLPAGFGESSTFRAASHRGRLATILAGPAVNIAMAAAAFVASGLVRGEPAAASLWLGFTDVAHVITGTAGALWLWVTNLGDYAASVVDGSGVTPAPVRFLSPVGQAKVSGWAVDSGLAMSLRWFGILSCAVGAVNLLPLPPLDGSHALVAAVEGGLGRVAPQRSIRLDVGRLLPLAYVTVAALVLLSLSALVLDLRDLT